jgi:hypothetical protein
MPSGFFTVQISENNQGIASIALYREHEFQLYNTEEDYPKNNWFVPTTHFFLTFMGHNKEYFKEEYKNFKLVATVLNKVISNYWLISSKCQRHPRYNKWKLAQD